MGVESARLTDLVAQIIELSRLQADDPLAQPEVVDIDEVLADAVDRCRVDAEQHEVTLTLAGATGGRRCWAAPASSSVAVGNLVENAVVYSDPGARVVVAAHVQATATTTTSRSPSPTTASASPPAEVDRIFERFYRVDYARSRANGGTGLGLSIVKHIAATHGGEVACLEPARPGSTFTIRIPAHLHRAGTTPADEAASVRTTTAEPRAGRPDDRRSR